MGEYVSAETGTAGELPYHRKHLALVTKITEKTRARKILWNHTATAVTASVPGQLDLSFIRGQGLLPEPRYWNLFTVRDKRGNEILRVQGGMLVLAKAASVNYEQIRRPLIDAVDQLYSEIEQQVGEQIQQVIEAIDRI